MRHTDSRLLALAAAAVMAGGCADNSPVVISSFEGISVSGGFCTASAGGAAGGLVRGVLDSTKGTGYVVGIEVQNLLADNSDKLRLNTQTAYVDSVSSKFRVIDASGLTPPSPQKSSITAVIKPGSNTSFPVTLLNTDNGQGLQGQAGELLVDVAVSGHLATGATFTTATVTFPVKVCTNCVAPCADTQKAVACSPDSVGQPDGFTCE